MHANFTVKILEENGFIQLYLLNSLLENNVAINRHQESITKAFEIPSNKNNL